MNVLKLFVFSVIIYVCVGVADTAITFAKSFTIGNVEQQTITNLSYVPQKEILAIQEALAFVPLPQNSVEPTPIEQPLVLGTFITIGPELPMTPIDPNGTIMIPKINVNSPIAFDIQVSDKKYYEEALDRGVAHALGTDKPTTEISNTYLFAHSTQFEEHISRYAAVFTKLNQLEIGDQIIIFYQGKRYDYRVAQEEIVPSFDVSVLARRYDYPALTLQTCYPPGIPKDRLITTARLENVYDR